MHSKPKAAKSPRPVLIFKSLPRPLACLSKPGMPGLLADLGALHRLRNGVRAGGVR